jgi:hypothetical protein
MSKNVCDCPQPPGFRAICESDQLAICRIKNGKPQTECQDPPSPLGRNISAQAYLEWAFEKITSKPALHMGEDLSNAQIAILRGGTYRELKTGEEITFRVPDFAWEKLAISSASDLEVDRFESFDMKDRGRSELR